MGHSFGLWHSALISQNLSNFWLSETKSDQPGVVWGGGFASASSELPPKWKGHFAWPHGQTGSKSLWSDPLAYPAALNTAYPPPPPPPQPQLQLLVSGGNCFSPGCLLYPPLPSPNNDKTSKIIIIFKSWHIKEQVIHCYWHTQFSWVVWNKQMESSDAAMFCGHHFIMPWGMVSGGRDRAQLVECQVQHWYV